MIRSFRSTDAELMFQGRYSKRFDRLAKVIERKLVQVHAAKKLSDLALFPGNHLDPLQGDREGQHSIRMNDRFRICFIWRAGDVFEVEIADYH